MTTTSPWAPQTGTTPVQGTADQRPLPPPPPSQSVPPQPPAAPRPPVERPGRRPSLWVMVLATAALMVVAVAATATITYAIVRNSAAAPPPATAATPAEPVFTAAQQSDAKARVCGTFDNSLRGQTGEGGLRLNGDLNVPVMLRSLNSIVAVQNALTPAVPTDVAGATHAYVDSALELNSAAIRNVSVDEGNRLNAKTNDAIFALADVCGLPR